MKKILSKILLFILAIVMATCGLIVAYSKDAGFRSQVSDIAKKLNLHIEIKKPEEEEEAAASAKSSEPETEAPPEAEVIVELADAASEVSSVTYVETKDKKYSEYLGDWSTSGINKEIIEEKKTDVDPLVNEDINEVDENGEQVTYYDNIDEMTGYSLPQRDIIELADQEAVNQALIDIGMGYNGNEYSFPSEFYPYYYMLNDNCKKMYRQIYANALNLWDEFLPACVTTPSEWNNALLSVVYDHPELFWLDTKLYTEYDYHGKVVKVKLYFYEDELGNLEEAKEKFNAYAENVLNVARAMEKDEDKEQFVHDYLAERLTYKENSLDQSAYSAIVNNETVCAGYSKAFQYLMQQLGIPTYLCVGWGGGYVSGGMHAWNIVKNGKKYANVDVTWDDKNPTIYEFYNRPDSDFHRHTRMFNSQYLPACQ
ncbi:MAG: hypothetical protein IKO76_02060 [Butyrivibrio sp.]|nr:hypothetical protein [Butyrivibrio sp.]